MPPVPHPAVLVVGATRGLGSSLIKLYASKGSTAYATTRSSTAPAGDSKSPTSPNIHWLTSVDVSQATAGSSLVSALQSSKAGKLDTVILTAGTFKTESFEEPNYEDQLLMYRTSAIAPTLIVSALDKAGLLKRGSKIFIVSSESGSITLRHPKEGGGNFGHHASKAASNMVGKLLSLDLKDKGVAVGVVHPGFMRTEMTAGVGFDKYWDDGGAVTPDEAASSLADFIETFDISKTGQYWAPRGARDIGTAEEVLGKNLPKPLELPW
ncbi:MAG: hypothetical protein M1825_001590 [Sarcosagium campestre]|nr:MAG: hypothetical protein M1825_001590 [Sarcosagium campestre]